MSLGARSQFLRPIQHPHVCGWDKLTIFIMFAGNPHLQIFIWRFGSNPQIWPLIVIPVVIPASIPVSVVVELFIVNSSLDAIIFIVRLVKEPFMSVQGIRRAAVGDLSFTDETLDSEAAHIKGREDLNQDQEQKIFHL